MADVLSAPESNAVRVQTKAKFDQLLQKAVTEYKKGDKKKKGKSNAADIVVCNFIRTILSLLY